MPPVRWDVDASKLNAAGWMGRQAITASTALSERANPRHPLNYPRETPEHGCPGGWYRSVFVTSIYPYLRRRDDHGNRVQNLILDRCDDDLILQLVAYAEDEQERWEGWRAEVMSS